MGKFKHTPNRLVTTTKGEKIWDSRSVAICAPIYLVGQGSPSGPSYFLGVRRGKGCPNEVGKLSFICGYLDRDESVIDCVKREIWEEIGLDLDEHLSTYDIIPFGYDDTLEGPQNITLRFIVLVPYSEIPPLISNSTLNIKTETRGGEPKEVSELVYLVTNETGLRNYSRFDPLAFNHADLGIKIVKELEL